MMIVFSKSETQHISIVKRAGEAKRCLNNIHRNIALYKQCTKNGDNKN